MEQKYKLILFIIGGLFVRGLLSGVFCQGYFCPRPKIYNFIDSYM